MEIIPKKSGNTRDDVYALNKEAYLLGRDHAKEKLSRGTGVQYKGRDLDMYNMGYSSGEIK